MMMGSSRIERRRSKSGFDDMREPEEGKLYVVVEEFRSQFVCRYAYIGTGGSLQKKQ